MRFNKVVRLFSRYSVAISGSKGSGKDLLMGNVIARRHLPYVSNMDYKCKRSQHYPFEYSKINVSGNTYVDFIHGNVKPYEYPYPDKTDIYISDAGIYFPSQYCGALDRDYKELATLEGILRHLGDARLHYNCQAQDRVWNKIREQCDYYIRCRRSWCIFGKLCITLCTTYDKASSAQDRVRPSRVKVPIFGNKVAKMNAKIYNDQFYNTYGEVHDRILIYWNKSKYNTRHFKEMMKLNAQ